jgi:hypothetical protein
MTVSQLDARMVGDLACFWRVFATTQTRFRRRQKEPASEALERDEEMLFQTLASELVKPEDFNRRLLNLNTASFGTKVEAERSRGT